jgi:hypothetical protein
VGVSALLIGSGSIRCRAVISDMFNWIYRCLEAAGAIEDLAAAAAQHFTEWLPRNIVAAP